METIKNIEVLEGKLQLNRFKVAENVIDKNYNGNYKGNYRNSHKDKHTYNYCIYDNVKGINDNLTEMFDKHFKAEDNLHIKLNLILEDGNSFGLKKEGTLEYRNDDGIYELYIGDTNLDELLWNFIGCKIKIRIENKEIIEEIKTNDELAESEDKIK